MKKSILLGASAIVLSMAFTNGCKPYNQPDNPWTKANPGTEKWFNDLTSGDESNRIPDIDIADLVGNWQLVATAEKDGNGGIVAYQDRIVYGDIERGGSQYFIVLNSDRTSSYSFYSLMDGLRVLNTVHGTWNLLNGKDIVFYGKQNQTANHSLWIGENVKEQYSIDLLEKNRVVLSHIGTDYGHGSIEVTYYEIYQRVNELPESEIKSAGDLLLASPWKVVSDSAILIGKTFSGGEGDPAIFDTLKVDVNWMAGHVLTFDKGGTLTITDAAGVQAAVYSYVAENFGSVSECQIHLTSVDNVFNLPEYVYFTTDIHDGSKAVIRTASMSYEPENPEWQYDGYDYRWYCHIEAIGN